MFDVVKKLVAKELDELEVKNLISFCLNRINTLGPNENYIMEILSIIKLNYPIIFIEYENKLATYMGTFYKDTTIDDINELAYNLYKEEIISETSYKLNPIQFDMFGIIASNKLFSFSAPTSVGKSFVLRKIVKKAVGNVCVIVPSRALINEYVMELELMYKNEKGIVILPFVDLINKARVNKYIFVLTPERARDLFKYSGEIDFELFLFDEAQISEEDNIRGLNFDSIVRRIERKFNSSKLIFAHPFVSNPQAQFEKHDFLLDSAYSFKYDYRAVGQLFFAFDEIFNFQQFTIFQENRHILKLDYDPIIQLLEEGKSILIYGYKTRIKNGKLEAKYQKYVDIVLNNQEPLCDKALNIIDNIETIIGVKGNTIHSNLTKQMKKRIIVHHGSLPLDVRYLIEEFVRSGFAKICFATSTLNQGINMPFSGIILDVLSSSNPLLVKNLIGRAGRSTLEKKYDVGYIFINESKRKRLKDALEMDVLINDKSFIDIPFEKESFHKEEDYKLFKDAIKNNSLNDEYNLPLETVSLLSSDSAHNIVSSILSELFDDKLNVKIVDLSTYLGMLQKFQELYEIKLGRNLEMGESKKFKKAMNIMFDLLHGRSFQYIVHKRYIRMKMQKYEEAYWQIPDRKLTKGFPLKSSKGREYDDVLYDTYDYIDNMIGFTLSDTFITAFENYYKETENIKAMKVVNLIRYGTTNEKTIMLMRYGYSDTEIEWLSSYILHIDVNGITFSSNIDQIDDEKLNICKRYM